MSDRAFIVIDMLGFILLMGTFGLSMYLDRHRKLRASIRRQQDVKIRQLTAKQTGDGEQTQHAKPFDLGQPGCQA